MERRRHHRQARRLPCELWLGEARHTGIVRDVSEHGLFVQTRLRALPGAELELVFAAGGERPELRSMVRVARRDVLTAQFSTAGAGGLGLEVLEGPSPLRPLLEEAGFATAPVQADDASSMRPFRVKVRQIQGPRSQTLQVRAPSAQSARARALQRAGRGWKVSEVSQG